MKWVKKWGYLLFFFVIFVNISGWLWVFITITNIEEISVAGFQHTQLGILNTASRSVSAITSQYILFSAVLMGIITFFSVLLVVGWVVIQKKFFKDERLILAEREQLISILDSIEEFIYISDPITYEILYTNKFVRDLIKKDPIGKTCYKEFQRRKAPCEFCTNKTVLQDKKKPFKWEYHNPIVNQDFLITDKIIKWSDGRDV